MKTEEIIKTNYFKKVLELIKSAIPEIIYPNEAESLAVKICQLVSPVPDLKSAKEEVKSAVNNIEIQEYTFDDYMKLEKETLVKLLMNCQKLLYGNQYAISNNHVEFTSSNQPIQSVKGGGERTDNIRRKLVAKAFEFEDSDGIKHSPWITLKDAIDILESYKHSESKDMYPKEFVEWLRLNAYVDPISHYWELINDSDIKDNYTTEKLFNHWSTVVTKR